MTFLIITIGLISVGLLAFLFYDMCKGDENV